MSLNPRALCAAALMCTIVVAGCGGDEPSGPSGPDIGPPAAVDKSAGDNQSATVATAVPNAPTVIVRDANRKAVPNVEVVFAVASGDGTITGATATTNSSGSASVGSWTLGTKAGVNTLTATVSGIPAATFSATGTPGPAARAAAHAGDNQTATVGAAVATPPAVRVVDAHDNPVAGVTVTFAVSAGGGSASGTSATTNAEGIAAVGGWTLGAKAGANSLTASVEGIEPVVFRAMGGAEAPASVAKHAGDAQSATVDANVASAPAVLVADRHGNPVAGVGVTFAVASGGGSITGETAVTNAEGIAAVGSWKLGTKAGANSLSATVGGLPPVTFTATGMPGAPASIAKQAGDNQNAQVGTAVATAPAVLVSDAHGNAVPDVTVTFAVGAGGGSVSGSSANTNAQGIAAVGSWTLGRTAGQNRLSAAVSGVAAPAIFAATGHPGAPSSLAKDASGDNQSAAWSTEVAVRPAVKVLDQYGNAVAGVAVTFSVVQGGGSVAGESPKSDAQGVATVGSWTLGPSGAKNILRASATGLTPVDFTATGVDPCIYRAPLAAGSTVNGSWRATDCQGQFDQYSLNVQGAASVGLELSMVSADVQAFLVYVYEGTIRGSMTQIFAAGLGARPEGSSEAKMKFRIIAAPRDYTMFAWNLGRGEGSYSISAAAASTDAAGCTALEGWATGPTALWITPGASTSQELRSSDCQIQYTAGGPTFYADRIGIVLNPGRTYTINMTSSALDTRLRLRNANGTIVGDNDDIDANNRNSRIVYTPPSGAGASLYFIEPTSAASTTQGAYTLAVEMAPVSGAAVRSAGVPLDLSKLLLLPPR